MYSARASAFWPALNIASAFVSSSGLLSRFSVTASGGFLLSPTDRFCRTVTKFGASI